jgi:hypothetical protein
MQQAAVLALLAEACLFASCLDEASTVGQRALTLARDGGQRGEEAVALRVLGDIATHPGQFDAEGAETTFVRRSPCAMNSACVRSSPTATWALEDFIAPIVLSRPKNILPSR